MLDLLSSLHLMLLLDEESRVDASAGSIAVDILRCCAKSSSSSVSGLRDRAVAGGSGRLWVICDRAVKRRRERIRERAVDDREDLDVTP
jgi:hypothetical protein